MVLEQAKGPKFWSHCQPNISLVACVWTSYALKPSHMRGDMLKVKIIIENIKLTLYLLKFLDEALLGVWHSSMCLITTEAWCHAWGAHLMCLVYVNVLKPYFLSILLSLTGRDPLAVIFTHWRTSYTCGLVACPLVTCFHLLSHRRQATTLLVTFSLLACMKLWLLVAWLASLCIPCVFYSIFISYDFFCNLEETNCQKKLILCCYCFLLCSTLIYLSIS